MRHGDGGYLEDSRGRGDLSSGRPNPARSRSGPLTARRFRQGRAPCGPFEPLRATTVDPSSTTSHRSWNAHHLLYGFPLDICVAMVILPLHLRIGG